MFPLLERTALNLLSGELMNNRQSSLFYMISDIFANPDMLQQNDRPPFCSKQKSNFVFFFCTRGSMFPMPRNSFFNQEPKRSTLSLIKHKSLTWSSSLLCSNICCLQLSNLQSDSSECTLYSESPLVIERVSNDLGESGTEISSL